PQVTTADLSHQYSITTLAFAQGAIGVSAEASKGMTYYPYSNRKPEVEQEATVGFPAAGLTGGGMAEVSGPIPLLTWGSQTNVNYSLPRPQMVSHTNAPVSGSQSVHANAGGGSPSFGQVLNELQGALQQLSATLSTYKSPN